MLNRLKMVTFQFYLSFLPLPWEQIAVSFFTVINFSPFIRKRILPSLILLLIF